MEPRTSITPEPAVLLVHGDFHLPELYAPFLALLAKAGFVTRCPRLPTNGDVRPPKATFEDDVAAVRAAAFELAGAGHRTVVVSHSWGGLVATEAITDELYAKGGKAGVVRLVYVSAWLIQPGTTLPQLFEKYGLRSGVKMEIDGDKMALPKNAREAFYNDMGSGKAQELTRKLVTHNLTEVSSGAAAITRAPWRDLPTTFVCCTKDMGIYLDLQKSMVKDAVENGAADLKVCELESGHSPFWSMPEAVVGIVEDVWISYVQG